MDQIPFVVHEADMTRMERTNRRVWILCIILVILLFGTNAGWMYYESQFEVVESSQEVQQEIDTGEGDTTVIGIGDINHGEGETNSKDNNNE